MRLNLPLLLLLSLGLFAANARPPTRPDPFSLSVEKVTAPFKNIYEGSQNKANEHLEQLKSFVNWETSRNPSDVKEQPKLEFRLDGGNADKDDDIVFEINEAIDSNGDDRMLAFVNPCQHNGTLRDTRVNIYVCNNRTVTKATYDAVGGVGCNALLNVTRKMCYCSFEFYGDICQNFNPWTCQLNRLNYPDQCQGTDSFDYVYGLDGIPPCYPVSDGQTIVMSTALVCQSADPAYDYEGVKPSKYQVVQQPDVGPNYFNYVVDGERVKLTFEPTDFNQEITFTNWNMLTQPYVITTPLTNEQIVGDSNIDTPISFVAPLTNFATVGRYYYEIIIKVGNMDNMSPVLTSNYYYGGYFEQAGYVEPSAPNRVNKPLVICLSIFGALLIIGAFLLYRKLKNKKAMAAYQLRADQLYGDDRQE